MSETGLRERKRLTAMRRIQDIAFDLFDRHGFDAVTIEQIAAAAEVSPSSVYRYFGTKEQLVLWDEYDPVAFARFAEELHYHPPLAAMRRAVASVGEDFFGPDRDRVARMVRLGFEEPAIAAGITTELAKATAAIGGIVADALDRDPDDIEVRVFAGAVVAAIEAALRHWHAVGFEPPLTELLDRALSTLGGGLDLQ